MKRFLIGFAILAVVVGLAVGYKFLTSSQPSTTGTGSTSSSGGLTYAKVEPLTLPPVGGYQLSKVDLGDGPVPLLTIPLDTWGGYAGLFAANGGVEPSKDSAFYKRGHFGVKLVRVEGATDQLTGYASGKYPLIWAQMDSLPLLYDVLKTDKRVAPKVLGLFDWSAGGDGILAKATVKSPADLKGKTILTSSNTPFAFFLLWYLAQNGLTGNDVHVVWVDDGAKALKLFKENSEIAAWVSWTPYINDCLDSQSASYVPNTRLMISSKDANQLIADCYIVRTDFLQDNKKIAQAFVEAMMDGSQQISNKTYQDMATFYKLANVGEAKSMLDDVHIANFPENKMFFDDNNTIGGKKIFVLSQEYYKELGALSPGTDNEASAVMIAQLIADVDKTGFFASQKNMVANSFNAKSDLTFSDLESKAVVLTDAVTLYFDANQNTFDINSSRAEFKKNMELLDKVAEQTKFLSGTAVELIGNSDPSRQAEYKSKGPKAYMEAAADLKLLSEQRADFIRTLLIDHYGVSANRILSKGVGWDNPIDPTDFAKDRRVDVKFISMK